MPIPEDHVREKFDGLLSQAGWSIEDPIGANLSVAHGVRLCNFLLKSDHTIPSVTT